MNSSPSVILKSRFIESSNKKGSSSFKMENFLEYLDRDNTKKHNNEIESYKSYQDYMGDDEKSTGLFTNDKDRLNEKDKEELKKIFKYGQEKGSILWQDVISFNNDWLKEIGVLKENNIDEEQLKNVIRETMNDMLKDEGMVDNSKWSGAIHYNTDNIHVHMATIQTSNFRERGKRKPQTLEKMKSNVINKLVDRTKENQKINDFIRNKLVNSTKENPINNYKNKLMNPDITKQFNKIYKSLPDDKRMWKYNMNAMKDIQPELNKLTDMYIEKNFKNEFKEFQVQVDKNVSFYKKMYGSNSQAESYKTNTYNDMYTRMGNSILSEMRELSKKEQQKQQIFSRNKGKAKFAVKREFQNSMFHLDRYLKNDFQSFKNQREYEQLQYEQDMNR